MIHRILYRAWISLAINGVWSRTVSSFSTQQYSRPNVGLVGRRTTNLPAARAGGAATANGSGGKSTQQISDSEVPLDHATLSTDDVWEEHFRPPHSSGEGCESSSQPYVSDLVRDMDRGELEAFLHDVSLPLPSLGAPDDAKNHSRRRFNDTYVDEPGRQLRLRRRRVPDPLWEQIKLEARHALEIEPDAGPQLYQAILGQPSLVDALANIISHEIETELMPATALRVLILDMLTAADDLAVHIDVIAAANRNPSPSSTALDAVMFNNGLHALVCYRVGHRLWQATRTGLAYYVQSTVSAKYAADIHPAAVIGSGLYLNVGGGVVIGETTTVGNDATILQGVTLGGTGKEAGDRHPKIGNGVVIHSGGTVLGNIPVGDGAVITAKSIVTKPVPPLARVSGVPAKVKSYRELREECFVDGESDLDRRLKEKFEEHWRELRSLGIDSGNSASGAREI